jgi:hypothetical protein
MESLQVAGVVAFIYGILWASATLRDAKAAVGVEYAESLRGIERATVLNSLGPLLPVLAALGLVGTGLSQALGVAVAAILVTVFLLALRGVLLAERMRGAGVPAAYQASYRKAHAIRAASLALCAATLLHPLLA